MRGEVGKVLFGKFAARTALHFVQHADSHPVDSLNGCVLTFLQIDDHREHFHFMATSVRSLVGVCSNAVKKMTAILGVLNYKFVADLGIVPAYLSQPRILQCVRA